MARPNRSPAYGYATVQPLLTSSKQTNVYYQDEQEDYTESDAPSDRTPHLVSIPPSLSPPSRHSKMMPEEIVRTARKRGGVPATSTHRVVTAAAVPSADVTELYRRNPVISSSGRKYIYHQNVYVPANEYYYDAPYSPTIQQARYPTAASNQNASSYRISSHTVANHPATTHYTAAVDDMYYQEVDHPQPVRRPTMMYQRSSAQLSSTPPVSAAFHHQSATMVRPTLRRHPVTVRTPRFIRRPNASALFKKPSALCLPIACQPDPANYRRRLRPRGVASVVPDVVYATAPHQQYQQNTQTPEPRNRVKKETNNNNSNNNVTTAVPTGARRMSTAVHPTLSKSQLNTLFTNYEDMYLKATENSPVEQDDSNARISSAIMQIAQNVPRSMNKRQQDNGQFKIQHETRDRGDAPIRKINQIPKDAETFDVQEITSQVLEELMCDLNENGFNENCNADDTDGTKIDDNTDQDKQESTSAKQSEENLTIKANQSDIQVPQSESTYNLRGLSVNEPMTASVKNLPKSFNYHDITRNMTRSQNTFQEDDGHSYTTKRSNARPKTAASSSRVMSEIKSPTSITCSRVTNVEEAMELHRTKSYVVNLIDTALSNHFGTSVCDKYSSHECSGLNPRNLVDSLKKHSVPKPQKDVCIEIANVLNHNYSASNHADCATEENQESCSCKVDTEPSYIKYLKQLRWGHLKHIQAEAKRLEELERFFDSCSRKAFCDKYP